MRSGGNNFNYFPENKLTKLANFVQFIHKHVLSRGLEGLGPLAPLVTPLDLLSCCTISSQQIQTNIFTCFVYFTILLLYYSAIQFSSCKCVLINSVQFILVQDGGRPPSCFCRLVFTCVQLTFGTICLDKKITKCNACLERVNAHN